MVRAIFNPGLVNCCAAPAPIHVLPHRDVSLTAPGAGWRPFFCPPSGRKCSKSANFLELRNIGLCKTEMVSKNISGNYCQKWFQIPGDSRWMISLWHVCRFLYTQLKKSIDTRMRLFLHWLWQKYICVNL